MGRKNAVETTKKCKYCQEEINKKAKVCPKCTKKQGMPGWLKALIVIGVLFAIIIAMMSSCVNSVDNAMKENENSYKDVNGKTTFKKGETFENKYIKLTMTETNINFTDYDEWSKVKDGYKILMVKFEAENIGEEDQFISYLDFNCYADDVAMEENYLVFNNYESLSATISQGKKTNGYIFYEIPTNAEKVTLEYDANWLDNNNIEFIVK